MKIAFKLFASLADYLPAERRSNRVELDLAPGTTVGDLIDRYRIPERSAHLVLVNGHYIEPNARRSHVLAEGDELAIWPPIAGGLKDRMVENVLAPEGFSREMSISMTEFERALRLAETDRTITVTAGRFRVEGDGAVLDVSLTPLPDRVIGMIRLPALAAHLRFLAGNGAERRTLLHRIDLAMRRGGG